MERSNWQFKDNLAMPQFVEALIDIQFEPRLPIEAINNFEKRIRPKFVRSQSIYEAVLGSISTKTGLNRHQQTDQQQVTALSLMILIRYYSAELMGIPLASYIHMVDGMIYAKQQRKLGWSFLNVLDHSTVTRVAVRYINDIKLPLPIVNFDDFFTCAPQVPENLPQSVSAFLQRVVIPDEKIACTSIITQALEEQPFISGQEVTSISVLLDVDVFKLVRIESSNVNAIWETLDVLRDQKNRMFFEHLTEKTVEMFA